MSNNSKASMTSHAGGKIFSPVHIVVVLLPAGNDEYFSVLYRSQQKKDPCSLCCWWPKCYHWLDLLMTSVYTWTTGKIYIAGCILKDCKGCHSQLFAQCKDGFVHYNHSCVHLNNWQDLHRRVYLEGLQRMSQSTLRTVQRWLCPVQSFMEWLSMNATVSPFPRSPFMVPPLLVPPLLVHRLTNSSSAFPWHWLLYQHTSHLQKLRRQMV